MIAAFWPPESTVAKLPAVGAIVSAPLTERRNRLLILSLQACSSQNFDLFSWAGFALLQQVPDCKGL